MVLNNKTKTILTVATGLAVIGTGCYGTKAEHVQSDNVCAQQLENKLPTVQEANHYLQRKLGSKLLGASKGTIKKTLTKRYGKHNVQLLMDGYGVSKTLLAEQQRQQKVQLAILDDKQKDYVGLSQQQINTDVTKPNQANITGERFDLGGKGFIPLNKTLTFAPIKDYQISNPIAFDYSMEQLIKSPSAKNNNTYTLFFFVKAPNRTNNRNELIKFVKSLNISANGHKAKLAVGKGKKDGLQMASLSQAANGLSLDKNRNIYPNSVVPVAFEVQLPKGQTIANTPIEVNGEVQPQLISTGSVAVRL